MRLLPQWARDARSFIFELRASDRWTRLHRDRPGRPHDLPGELVVSLTSYPPRFPTLALTLACLCDQTVRADRIILWIAREDTGQLPNEVRWNMRQAGVEIRACDDIGPYKKLIPALEAFPEAFIATADDDVYYPRGWLETLVSSFDGSISCARANRIKRLVDGALAPYLEWGFNASDGELMPVGAGGILYPPQSLHPDVTDRAQFLSLCPTGDDLWYWHMAKKAGSKVRKVGRLRKLITWPGTDTSALWNVNALANDRMLARLS